MFFNVKETAIQIGEIPAVYIAPEDEKDILLLYYHGWASSVESSRFRASIWAAAGYPVLLIEELIHGERGSIDYENSLERLPEVLIRNIEEFDEVLAYVQKNFPHKRLFLCGHSMGAFTALGLLYREEIEGAIAMNGMGDWDVMKCHPYKEKIEAYEPLARVEEHADKAVLLLNGELDDTVDPELEKNYYEALKRVHNYEKPLYMEIMEMTSHVVTTNMMEITLRFLEDL
ncbi:esterase [Aedoeadaptatus ivorii]|uniref:Esterase n=1 Tax=Aedoeadaptatus ivorii TaxID=54006 RepID=A0A448V007_9FIRM|nr:alpha/beta hydrolase [Peptoniphilus ivorii]MDQ0507956.1 putative esterase [Peptoniphilus ivorii]VEJ34773.1 esterase [Peptoniphilus ivorii]